jgi:2-keto-3-deoxy-L-rhamnonate aldolase RhmA
MPMARSRPPAVTTSTGAGARRFRLLLFTADPHLARDAVNAGIDGIVIDWERRGKDRRQADADTEINRDTEDDLRAVRAATTGRVLCRIDALGRHSDEQIDRALACGADEILLPMVRSAADVAAALDLVAGRCALGILVETVDAVRCVEELAVLPVAHAYVGLNDLAIERGTPNIFTALVDGTVEHVCRAFAAARIPYGFGGLTVPGRGEPVPCRLLIAEMARLGCAFGFLRRSFRRDTLGAPLAPAVASMRAALAEASARAPLAVLRDTRELAAAVADWNANGREAHAGA